MTTKQYLGQLSNIDRRIKDQMSEYRKWIDIATSTSSNNSGERVQSSGSHDKMADAVIKAIEYSKEANEEATRLTELKHTISRQICSIKDEEHYNILYEYFVEDRQIKELRLNKDYSYKHLRRLLSEAMNHFEDLYGANYIGKG